MPTPFQGADDPALCTMQPSDMAECLDPVMATQAELDALADQVSAITSFSLGAPSVSSATLDTPFQPRSDGPSCVSILASFTALVSGGVAVSVQTSPTEEGDYTEVGATNLITIIATLPNAKETLQVLVPTAHWLKVTATGGTPTVTKVVWNLT